MRSTAPSFAAGAEVEAARHEQPRAVAAYVERRRLAAVRGRGDRRAERGERAARAVEREGKRAGRALQRDVRDGGGRGGGGRRPREVARTERTARDVARGAVEGDRELARDLERGRVGAPAGVAADAQREQAVVAKVDRDEPRGRLLGVRAGGGRRQWRERHVMDHHPGRRTARRAIE